MGDGTRFWSSFGGADHYDYDSMAYAWSLENHRFVATHNYPTYTAKDCQAITKDKKTGKYNCEKKKFGLGLHHSLDFLRDELAFSESRGQSTTLMLHDYDEH